MNHREASSGNSVRRTRSSLGRPSLGAGLVLGRVGVGVVAASERGAHLFAGFAGGEPGAEFLEELLQTGWDDQQQSLGTCRSCEAVPDAPRPSTKPPSPTSNSSLPRVKVKLPVRT